MEGKPLDEMTIEELRDTHRELMDKIDYHQTELNEATEMSYRVIREIGKHNERRIYSTKPTEK